MAPAGVPADLAEVLDELAQGITTAEKAAERLSISVGQLAAAFRRLETALADDLDRRR